MRLNNIHDQLNNFCGKEIANIYYDELNRMFRIDFEDCSAIVVFAEQGHEDAYLSVTVWDE